MNNRINLYEPKIEDVKKLREETGAGLDKCREALQLARGDYAEAKRLLRVFGTVKCTI